MTLQQQIAFEAAKKMKDRQLPVLIEGKYPKMAFISGVHIKTRLMWTDIFLSMRRGN